MEKINTTELFGNDEVKQTLLSLSENEKKEFEVDLALLLQNTNKEEGHHIAHLKLGDKFFRVELLVDLSPNKKPIIMLQQFIELNTDEYLDIRNADKNLINEGFKLQP